MEAPEYPEVEITETRVRSIRQFHWKTKYHGNFYGETIPDFQRKMTMDRFKKYVDKTMHSTIAKVQEWEKGKK